MNAKPPRPEASTLAWAVLFLSIGGIGMVNTLRWWTALWFAGCVCWGAFRLKQFTQQVIVWAEWLRTGDPGDVGREG